MQNDLMLINKGIKSEILTHKREYVKEHDFYHISEKTTSWTKLAQHFGYTPDISSEFIHKELLGVHKGIDYEDIGEVYKALEIKPL